MSEIFSIAIDGPSGAGKSSVAKLCAAALNATYLDTGAMYRAVGLHMLRQGVNLEAEAEVVSALPGAQVDVRYVDGEQRVFLGEEDVSRAIRDEAASRAASQVSRVPQVRQAMVALQQAIARDRSVVMDGRDIGTKVLPHATLKVFLTADAHARARRRYEEYLAKGVEQSYEQVYSAIVERDRIDTSRAASPLVQAEDAILLDTTAMPLEEVARRVLALARERLGGMRQ